MSSQWVTQPESVADISDRVVSADFYPPCSHVAPPYTEHASPAQPWGPTGTIALAAMTDSTTHTIGTMDMHLTHRAVTRWATNHLLVTTISCVLKYGTVRPYTAQDAICRFTRLVLMFPAHVVLCINGSPTEETWYTCHTNITYTNVLYKQKNVIE